MNTRKYLHLRFIVYYLVFSYIFGFSMAILKSNLWMLLLGPVTHLAFYIVMKVMDTWIESHAEE